MKTATASLAGSDAKASPLISRGDAGSQPATPSERVAESIACLFDLDLGSRENRIRLAPRHPMLDQLYTAQTNEIDSFNELCFDWALARKSGLYACAPYRMGKTKAISSAITSLGEQLPNTATLSCIGQRNLHQSKESFCRYFLDCWGYSVDALPRRVRAEPILLNYLITQCEEAGGRHCILFIDEAQLFSVLHYRYLLEIWNGMRDRGYILSTVLVGQPELKQLKELTSELDHGAVVSRFFVKGHSIGGIKSEDMLTTFLANYDDQLYFPVGSSWSYSRYFLSEAFEHGWRLQHEGPVFWQALCSETDAQPKLIKSTGFRLAWIVDAIHAFLLDSMKDDSPKFHGTVDMWQELLSASTDRRLLI